MSGQTSIEWTDATWNPTRGCSRVSPGCERCYAERVAARFSGPGLPYEGLARRTGRGAGLGARWTGVVRIVDELLDQPIRWRRPRRIFVNSMSDLFHESLTDYEIAAVFGAMVLAPQHTFQILTKRPTRMEEWFRNGEGPDRLIGCFEHHMGQNYEWPYHIDWPLPNVWLGVSVEDQARADERIPLLLKTPAARRFLSVEPLLARVELGEYLWDRQLHWVIVGAESGPNARPMDINWVRSLRDECAYVGVPFFFKQAVSGGRKVALPFLDGRQWAEFPS